MPSLQPQPTRAEAKGFLAPDASCQIAVLQGAPGRTIQALLGDFALRLRRAGHKIAGVVELTQSQTGGGCRHRAVRDLYTGTIIGISQDLGPASMACNLDSSGLIQACAAVERSIAAGVDLVILSKFGKLEAERRGLSDAFAAAISAELPVLTAVSPTLAAAWREFAGPLSRLIPAEADAIAAWWSQIRPEIALPTSG